MFQGIGEQLTEHVVQSASARPQAMNLLQQLHQVRHRVESLEAFTAQFERQRPVQRTGAPTVGIQGRRGHPVLATEHAYVAQADVIPGAAAKTRQGLHYLIEQLRRVTIGGQHLAQALDTEQALVLVCGIDHAIGQQQQPLPRRHRQHFGAVIEALRREDAQRQMTRPEPAEHFAVYRQPVAIRHAAIPHFHRPALHTQVEQQRTAKHVHRQDALELGIHLAQHLRQAIALRGHPVEHFRQRHRPHCRRQAMPGEIPQQHMHVTGRGKRSQQQVTIEQRIGRLQVTDVRRRDAAGMRDLVEHRLGHPLLVEQVMMVAGDLVTLLEHGRLQTAQAVHGADLGREDHRTVGLGHEVVTAGLQASHQGILFAQRGQEDDRHQRLAGQCLDLPRRLETIHHRHQGVEQHQLRTLFGKQRHGLLAIFRSEHPVALATHNLRQQHAVYRTVLRHQYGQRMLGRHLGTQLISNSFSKLEMARILRTSELACTTRTSESSPPAWSRNSSSMPSAELSR